MWLIHTCTLSLFHLAGGTLASSSRDRALRMLCITLRGSPGQKEPWSEVAWRRQHQNTGTGRGRKGENAPLAIMATLLRSGSSAVTKRTASSPQPVQP